MSKANKLEQMSTPRFLSLGSSPARSIAFSPVEPHLFAAGTGEGNVRIYNACQNELLSIHGVVNIGLNRCITALKFTNDGRKMLACSNTKRMSVLDLETGSTLQSFDDCAYNAGRDRAALAVDPYLDNIAACNYINGKGITFFDLRMPLPFEFHFDFHKDVIKDMMYLHSSWPFAKIAYQNNLLSLSSQGMAQVSRSDGHVIASLDFNHTSNAITCTPEHFGSCSSYGFTSALVCAGPVISSYSPACPILQYAPQGLGTSVNNCTHHLSLESSPSSGSSSLSSASSLPANPAPGSSLDARPRSGPSRLDFSSLLSRIVRSLETPRVYNFDSLNPGYQVSPAMVQGSNSRQISPGDGGMANNNGNSTINIYIPSGYNVLGWEPHMRNASMQHAAQQVQNRQQHYAPTVSLPRDWSPVVVDGNGEIIDAGPISLNELGHVPAAAPNPDRHEPLVVFHNHWSKDGFCNFNSTKDSPEISRMRFSRNGAFLYVAGDGGAVKIYQRTPKAFNLKYLGEVMSHADDVIDFDLSCNDEYLVTASRDKTVGIIHLGPPNYGSSEYYEIS